MAALLAAPVIVIESGGGAAQAAGGGLVSAGSVTLSSLVGTTGTDGVQSPETHAAEADAGSEGEHSPGPAPTVRNSQVRPAGPELTSTFAGLNHRDNRLANGGNQFSSEPPDQALCVGPGHVLEGVNTFAVYDKAGLP